MDEIISLMSSTSSYKQHQQLYSINSVLAEEAQSVQAEEDARIVISKFHSLTSSSSSSGN